MKNLGLQQCTLVEAQRDLDLQLAANDLLSLFLMRLLYHELYNDSN